MLMPKRVKRRRVHRGRLTGQANKGNKSRVRRIRLSCVGAELDNLQSD